ncbi:tyrosine-protein phosphatase [Nocardia farcinica]|uniref:Tyrosine specific protein phosphatases domain-containing protein n=2 Tax=Nocardia farcinica TaxID=37329 RepID=Q5YQK3_NOCFA|nr:tyrosine-protein phosphatase [Nocardia farcinica]AXK87991.1 protein-tyrosine-phosphatase [Nocardia farcinica]MBA4858893.1 tyrosine-protein phosphatase [Nocardia farcinica]MBC9816745.1 tyrosine-protein phosphatase [Nocardia farcinica]MBF6444279.1 tyrosine-protein phosphatase [Nocardia farcinica]MBF6523645.1 tyrosine-protein phosphatase [Nocardia farcinica]
MTSPPPADQFHLSGTFNFRDTGGLRTVDGAKVRPGVLLRSAQLSGLDDRGHATLRELRVTDVHDLRGLREIDHIGHDNLPADVRLRVTPFDSRMGEAPPHDSGDTDAFTHMLEVYRAFPALPEANAAIVELAESIVRGDGAVLVHCAAGKDRTGWAVATLLRAVGVSEEDVLADYLRSNEAVPALRAMLTATMGPGAEPSPDLLGVREEYLRIGTESVRELHGDHDSFLAAAGLDARLRERLRERMLE